MKFVKLGNTNLKVPAVVAGCMRLAEKTPDEMNRFIHQALEMEANFFDHADIYGGGKSEEVFGNALKSDSSIKRDQLIIQSKCGINNKTLPSRSAEPLLVIFTSNPLAIMLETGMLNCNWLIIKSCFTYFLRSSICIGL